MSERQELKQEKATEAAEAAEAAEAVEAKAPSMFKVTIEDTGDTYACGAHESLLHGMARLGKRGIPIGCRGGGCGVCKVEVTSGDYDKKAMSRDHVSKEEEQQGRVLACRIYPRGDVQVRVIGKLKVAVSRQ